MSKYNLLFLLVIFFFIISCENNKKKKNDISYDSAAAGLSSKREDSATWKFSAKKSDAVIAKRNTQSVLNGSNLKTSDYIKQYPAKQTAELRRHMERLRKVWQNVPNPITATYQGNDFGDYHHILFKAANGVAYDFGQANNSYGQYDDNPELVGKKFTIFWDWKLSEFLCCDGEYNEVKAYLPSITKLELIKN
jgi:hypothetical protein